MRNFIHNSILFITPFLGYLVIVIIVDPFNYFSKSFNFLDNSRKYEISAAIEPHLYKLIAFDNNPNCNVMLGDSRTTSLFRSNKNSTFADLSYGGASLNEVIQTFWHITKSSHLDTVLIGINFNLYNKYNKRFWVEETIKRKKNAFTYTFNRYTFQATFQILKKTIYNRKIEIRKPPFSKDEFWRYQIEHSAKRYFEKFELPNNYYSELTRISQYCRFNKITLIFWIPPNHAEFQRRVEDFGLENSKLKFKKELMSLGEVFDFDFPSELTKRKDNFDDPMHFNKEIGKLIYDEILTNCNMKKLGLKKLSISRTRCDKE